MLSYHQCKSAGVGSMPRWAVTRVIIVGYRTNIFRAAYELFIVETVNTVERADLMFRNFE